MEDDHTESLAPTALESPVDGVVDVNWTRFPRRKDDMGEP